MAKEFTKGTLPGGTQFVTSNPYVPTTTFGSPDSGVSPALPSFGESAFQGLSGIDELRASNRARGIGTAGLSTVGRRTGTRITEFGRGDFDAALVDWNKVYADAQEGIPAALELIEQFAPGGTFGLGLRQEAKELVRGGVARDTAAAVAAGASSISSARGLNVLAGRELSTQFANIEDLRASLQIQAFQPYTQMLSNLANIGISRPTTGQFIDRIVTPEFGLRNLGKTTIASA